MEKVARILWFCHTRWARVSRTDKKDLAAFAGFICLAMFLIKSVHMMDFHIPSLVGIFICGFFLRRYER